MGVPDDGESCGLTLLENLKSSGADLSSSQELLGAVGGKDVRPRVAPRKEERLDIATLTSGPLASPIPEGKTCRSEIEDNDFETLCSRALASPIPEGKTCR